MKSNLPHITAGFACFASALASLAPTAAAERSLTDFEPRENKELRWSIVNDGVMGGLSRGKVDLTESGLLRFSGMLSLENNGGFSSLRTGDLKLDLSDSDGIAARVKGDGRTYQLRLASDARYRGMEVSFMAEFPTTKGEWKVVRIPFGEFTGSFRGRTLGDEALNTSDIRRIGLLIADKKAGPFEVEVDWIRAFGGENGRTVVATALADGRFETLATLLTKAGLVDLLDGDGPFTVFAPTDEAFSRLPDGIVDSLLEPGNRDKLKAVLKFHVSPGATKLAGALEAGSAATAGGESLAIAFEQGKVLVNDAAILDADIVCSNGVIHVIDSVLLPPTPVESKDILGVARSAGNFNTLIAAVEAAGLTSALQGEGPFTVLAPTDEAFEALPDGAVANLLKSENIGQLKAVLSYHAIPGAVSAGDALNAKSAKSLSGLPLEFGVKNGRFKVNGATIVGTDIACENGVIHVIDSVLLPPEDCSEPRCGGETAEVAPRDLIKNAIERGVPVFNHGDHRQCAEIYQVCLEELAADERIDGRLRTAIDKFLKRADATDCDRDRAWICRDALDHVYMLVSSCDH